MRATIYNEPAGGGIGGSEYCAAVLAAGLAPEYEVELVHHRPNYTHSLIENTFDEQLDGVSLRYLPSDWNWACAPTPWWRAQSQRRSWKAQLSQECDVFIAITHWVPPFSHAPLGILYVLFPMFDVTRTWPWGSEVSGRSSFRTALRQWYYRRDWRTRLESYSSVVSISEYTRRWTTRYWGHHSSIIYPPVNVSVPDRPRADSIVTVGRLCAKKRQHELVAAFASLAKSESIAANWRMECCGNPAEADYFEELEALAGLAPVRLVVGAPREDVLSRLATSKIFWHGMGLDCDEEEMPQELEHFGIATVEAMAAGCVPVVIAKGGQCEIVEHGVSGFLWTTLDEMKHFTLQLMADDDLRKQMSDAARLRARKFSKENFLDAFKVAIRANHSGNGRQRATGAPH